MFVVPRILPAGGPVELISDISSGLPMSAPLPGGAPMPAPIPAGAPMPGGAPMPAPIPGSAPPPLGALLSHGRAPAPIPGSNALPPMLNLSVINPRWYEQKKTYDIDIAIRDIDKAVSQISDEWEMEAVHTYFIDNACKFRGSAMKRTDDLKLEIRKKQNQLETITKAMEADKKKMGATQKTLIKFQSALDTLKTHRSSVRKEYTLNWPSWTLQQLLSWITHLQNGRFRPFQKCLNQSFDKYKVNGSHLAEMDKSDLYEFGVRNYGERMSLMAEIKALLKQFPPPYFEPLSPYPRFHIPSRRRVPGLADSKTQNSTKDADSEEKSTPKRPSTASSTRSVRSRVSPRRPTSSSSNRSTRNTAAATRNSTRRTTTASTSRTSTAASRRTATSTAARNRTTTAARRTPARRNSRLNSNSATNGANEKKETVIEPATDDEKSIAVDESEKKSVENEEKKAEKPKIIDPNRAQENDRYLDPIVNIPNEFLCPITREIMTDPVLAADGHTYQRESINLWLKSYQNYSLKSPKTNLRMKSRDLIPNHSLKALIETYCMTNGLLDYLAQHKKPSRLAVPRRRGY